MQNLEKPTDFWRYAVPDLGDGKLLMTRNVFKDISARTAADIAHQHLYYELVAVSRGGLTFAHQVAHYLNRLLSFFVPPNSLFLRTEAESLAQPTLIFLEDRVSTGRRLQEISEVMERRNRRNWLVYPMVASAAYGHQNLITRCAWRTESHIVFPQADD